MAKFNVPDRTILLGDNLPHLRGINSDSVDLVYLDPPFNKNTPFIDDEDGTTVHFVDSFSVDKHGDSIVEELRAVGEENEVLCDWLANVKNIDQDRKKSNYAYLVFMSVRLLECYRILKPTGSLFLHCDDTMNAWLRITLGLIFGTKNFRNEISWKRSTARSASRKFPRLTDTIFWYSKSKDYQFFPQHKPLSECYIHKHYKHREEGTNFLYRKGPITVGGSGNRFEFLGVVRNWMWTKDRLEQAHKEGMIVQDRQGSVPWIKLYLKDRKGVQISDFWEDIGPVGGTNQKGKRYRTRKPEKLMERIIFATTKKKDIVVDPFCGCATTCVAADNYGRRWVGIDESPVAQEKIRERLPDLAREINCTTKPPVRSADDSNGFGAKHVYVMSCAHIPGWYKIGIAVDCKSRLQSFFISSPFREEAYKMEFVSMKTIYYRDAEKHIHDKFNAHGEWVESDSVKDITSEIKQILKIKTNDARSRL